MITRVFQTIHTDLSQGIIGNCRQACIASLTRLPLDEIPRDRRDCEDYLEVHGFRIESFDGVPPCDGNYYIASYYVAKAHDTIPIIFHCVIWKNGRIVHDPKHPRVRLWKMHHHYKITQV